ncbi:MAG: hypothetical protein ABW360_00110 [Phenylobacterium sp.]
MRAATLALVFAAAAGAAAAQSSYSPTPYTDQARINELQTQQELSRQRAISQDNQFQALDAQIRTEQAIRDIQVQRQRQALPLPDPNAPPPVLDTSKLASIPDATLAASNEAVREASRPRR